MYFDPRKQVYASYNTQEHDISPIVTRIIEKSPSTRHKHASNQNSTCLFVPILPRNSHQDNINEMLSLISASDKQKMDGPSLPINLWIRCVHVDHYIPFRISVSSKSTFTTLISTLSMKIKRIFNQTLTRPYLVHQGIILGDEITVCSINTTQLEPLLLFESFDSTIPSTQPIKDTFTTTAKTTATTDLPPFTTIPQRSISTSTLSTTETFYSTSNMSLDTAIESRSHSNTTLNSAIESLFTSNMSLDTAIESRSHSNLSLNNTSMFQSISITWLTTKAANSASSDIEFLGARSTSNYCSSTPKYSLLHDTLNPNSILTTELKNYPWYKPRYVIFIH